MPHDPFLNLTENQSKENISLHLEKLSLSEDQLKPLEVRTRRQHHCEVRCIEKKKVQLKSKVIGTYVLYSFAHFGCYFDKKYIYIYLQIYIMYIV